MAKQLNLLLHLRKEKAGDHLQASVWSVGVGAFSFYDNLSGLSDVHMYLPPTPSPIPLFCFGVTMWDESSLIPWMFCSLLNLYSNIKCVKL